MNTINRTSVQSALPGLRYWSILLGSIIVVACGAKSSEDANSTPPAMAGTGTLGSTASDSSGGTSAGSTSSTGGATTGGTSLTGWIVATRAGTSSTFPSGGVSGGVSAVGTFSTGGTGLADTQIPDASNGDSGQACSCDMGAVDRAIEVAFGAMPATCVVTSEPTSSFVWGTILFDSEGRPTNVAGAQVVVSTLDTEGWCCPALAGVTLQFWCNHM